MLVRYTKAFFVQNIKPQKKTILFLIFMFLLFFLVCLSVFTGNTKSRELDNYQNLGETSTEVRIQKPDSIKVPEGMVWIPGGRFRQGAYSNDSLAMKHERPAHPVLVDGFFMDTHEVTNEQFAKFVEATGYITVAEQQVDWEELKKQLPTGTPKPKEELLQAGSLVFRKNISSIANYYDYSQWWNWTTGANWRHPNGPESDIKDKEKEPVVHIAYQDALAYCEWIGRRLPTEAEWEYAARGQVTKQVYYWGNDTEQLHLNANTWEGEFPISNTLKDGFELRAPVGSFKPNGFGLYDMSGNVWEWTSDWYNTDYYNKLYNQKEEVFNPKGARFAYNPTTNPRLKERVIKGGSFLCNASYCASYRISSRMASTEDSSMEHLGFRTVVSPDEVK